MLWQQCKSAVILNQKSLQNNFNTKLVGSITKMPNILHSFLLKYPLSSSVIRCKTKQNNNKHRVTNILPGNSYFSIIKFQIFLFYFIYPTVTWSGLEKWVVIMLRGYHHMNIKENLVYQNHLIVSIGCIFFVFWFFAKNENFWAIFREKRKKNEN